MSALLHSKPIATGIIGTVASGAGSAVAFFQQANIVLAFVAAFFSCGTAVCTFILVLRKVRKR